MPSTTRGSILISTANDIGEALVEKLGGVGYSPNDWKNNINLCGIAPVDSAPALSVLSDSAGTGDERGSILIATADAIGAILNKKYNVLRGFKPKEWASACRKMKALEEGSVASASIASFSDGADDVPTKSLIVTIPPTLSGVSSVKETQTGRNLFNVADYSQIYTDRDGVDSYNYRYMIIQLKPNTTYTVSQNSGEYSGTPIILINNALPVGGANYFDLRKASDTKTYTTDSTGRLYIGSDNSYDDVAYARLQVCNMQIEVGSTAHAYEPYTAPTTYTASLGRTIYGGTADIVNGVGSDENNKFTVTSDMSDSIRYIGSGDTAYIQINKSLASNSRWQDLACSHFTPANIYAGGTQQGIGCYSAQFYIRDSQFASKQDFLDFLDEQETLGTPLEICYKLATPTDFTFTGQEVPTRLGYNAFWSEQGDTAVEYYKAPTPYTRKTATGGIANFSDQRTDLPLTKAIANIAPSIAGKSAVNLYRTAKNLLPDKTYQRNANTLRLGTDSLDGRLSLKAGTYTLSLTSDVTIGTLTYTIGGTSTGITFTSSGTRYYGSFTLSADTDDIFLHVYKSGGITAENVSDFMLEVGSSASAYVPYSAPTTYTAELGETVYGGSVDFVSGEVEKICGKITFNGSENWSAYTTGNGYSIPLTGMERGTWYTSPLALSYPLPKVPNNDSLGVRIGVNNDGIYVVQANTIEGVTDITSFKAYLSENPLTIIYPLATPTESAIPGRVISPIEGVNNYWNDAGGDTEIQYFESEA